MNFLLCINNEGYLASLDLYKVYCQLPDPEAEENDLVRVIDNSGEDYLFPADYFAPVELSERARQALVTA
jgi:Ca2+-binding EF-hand superfamily protein